MFEKVQIRMKETAMGHGKVFKQGEVVIAENWGNYFRVIIGT